LLIVKDNMQEQITADILRLWSVIQQTFPEIPKEYVIRMWEEYSAYNGSWWLKLPETDAVIDMELTTSGIYKKYEEFKSMEWKTKLAGMIIEEAGMLCGMNEVSKIIPGITPIINVKESIGIIQVGENIKLIIHCEK